MRVNLVILGSLALVSCRDGQAPQEISDRQELTYDQFLVRLAETYRKKPEDYSRAYALIKNGAAGPDWLLTVHGLPDNLAACEEIIAPYNANPQLSVLSGTYSCEEIGDSFWGDAKP